MRSGFIRGLAFAWIPVLLFMVPAAMQIFRSVSGQKATGLGAVAGGLTNGLVIFGIVAVVACEVYGVVLLARSFSRQHMAASLLALVSIAFAALVLLLVGGLVFGQLRAGLLR